MISLIQYVLYTIAAQPVYAALYVLARIDRRNMR